MGTPANWQMGGEVVVLPSVDDATAIKMFPKGFHAVTPYLRLIEVPVSGSDTSLPVDFTSD